MLSRAPLEALTLLPLAATAALSLTTATPAAQSADVVLYPSDVSTIVGNWHRASSTSGAGGQKMTSQDRGWSTDVALASPADYFEVEFEAEAGVAYRLWLRLRAAEASKYNESVWVQFDAAVDGEGAPLWPIGTAAALLVNLEDCWSCGVSGWGWQDNAWWLEESSVVRFATSGRHRVRVQTREDGVDVDQIVLSASRYEVTPPGAVRDDTIVVPKTRGPTPAIARGPYLQSVTDSTAVIVWTTALPEVAELRYTATGGTTRTSAVETRPFRAGETGLSYDFYQHEAHLVGLQASTRYAYHVMIGGAEAAPGTNEFTTAPLTGSGTVRFIAFGDSGVGTSVQRELASRMTVDSFDLAIHAGDVAYGTADGVGGGSYAQYESWVFGVYAPWLRSRAIFPAVGNHDDEIDFARAYRDVFVLPENGGSGSYPDHAERYYSFDYGPVHFVALDTELAFQDLERRQAQLAWLEADLAATSQPWRVVYLHRPPYSAGTHHGSSLDVRQAFAPLFERYGVQLVIAAHEHNYERSIPWREFVADGGAVTYVVSGGGGGILYPAGTASWTAASVAAHHYVRATAAECTLSGEAVGIDGAVFDSFSIDRCGATPPEPSVGDDVVLHADDVGTMNGNWARLPSSSGAGNVKMSSDDRGESFMTPRAEPADFFEATFDAPAGDYRLWLRLRGAADSKYNESVWVQLSDASDQAGTPVWRIGTDSALLVNLEDCSGCGISTWGWQDNAWWLGDSSVVRFTNGGDHTIRVQTREDGVEIDQIVLSPMRFFTLAPGAVTGDQTIVQK